MGFKLKGVWNVGEIEFKALLFGKQVRAQDRIVEVTLDQRIEGASRDGQGFRFGHRKRRFQDVVNDDEKLSRRAVRRDDSACRGKLERYGKDLQRGTPINVHLLEMASVGLCVNVDWVKQPGDTRRSKQDLSK